MSTPLEFAQTLKQQADIVRVVGDYVKLKKAGAQNYAGLCPFHSEKTASFSVHATRQFFHCFGCGASGDVFTFIQKVENVTFPESVRLIAQKLGVPLPRLTYSSPAEARDAEVRGKLLDVHDRACEFFRAYLGRPEGAHAREYLKRRGLNDQTVAAFRIGYAPDSGFLLRDALRREFAEDLLRESGLFSWKEDNRAPESGQPVPGGGTRTPDSSLAIYSKFRNRVMFPIANEQGKIIAFTGRTLSTDEKAGPKYLNSPETAIYSKSRVLFNLDHAREAIRKLEYAILVEGQMDCISLFAAGFHNVIASSGTAFTELQARLLGRFSKKVVVNFDPDTAGARATERTLGLLVEEEFEIRVLTLEPGFDPDLFIRRKGKDAYAQALRDSQPYFTYLIDRARGQFPVRTPEGKVKALNFLLPHIQRVPSRIVRDELAQEIAQKLAIDSAVLRQELKHAAGKRSGAGIKAPPEVQVTDAERLLVRALASSSEMQAGEHFSARDGAEEEFDPARQARFALESERLHEGLASEALLTALLPAAGEVADPMSLPLSEGDQKLLATVLMKEDEQLTPERVEGALRALRRIHLRRKLEQLQRELEGPGVRETSRTQQLLLEKVRLKRALMDPALTGESTLDR
ncbi:MAG TPA: DNA primase [Terriglobales bacterium]|nr:DNA primase [Terriglobales bacterium]